MYTTCYIILCIFLFHIYLSNPEYKCPYLQKPRFNLTVIHSKKKKKYIYLRNIVFVTAVFLAVFTELFPSKKKKKTRNRLRTKNRNKTLIAFIILIILKTIIFI